MHYTKLSKKELFCFLTKNQLWCGERAERKQPWHSWFTIATARSRHSFIYPPLSYGSCVVLSLPRSTNFLVLCMATRHFSEPSSLIHLRVWNFPPISYTFETRTLEDFSGNNPASFGTKEKCRNFRGFRLKSSKIIIFSLHYRFL